MSAVVGIDLSSHAIDLVKLDETTNAAEWVRCELAGKDAWERTLAIPEAMPPYRYWDDVYLCALEIPTPDQQKVLRCVMGSVAACLPRTLRQAGLCWNVHPQTWKAGLGLKGKPTRADVQRIAPGDNLVTGLPMPLDDALGILDQNARDAYCLAMYARDLNARAVADTHQT